MTHEGCLHLKVFWSNVHLVNPGTLGTSFGLIPDIWEQCRPVPIKAIGRGKALN